jgi:Zn-dependent protease
VNIRNLRRGRRDYVLVAAAGPASNLAIAVLASLALSVLPVSPMRVGEPNVSAPIATLLAQAVPLNVLLAVFNMIPIPPLDGGNVLGGLLPRQIGARYDALVRPYGFILLYALLLTRGFDYLVVPPARFLLSWLQ